MQEKTLQNPKIRTSNIHSSEFGSVSYDIFGSPYKKTGSFLATDSLDFGYLGKPYNADTELYDYGFRDYSPEIAHFTSVDPIRDGRNWFSYVVNDPVNYVDLWGLCGSDGENSSIDKAISILRQSDKLSEKTKSIISTEMIENLYQAEWSRMSFLEKIGIDGSTIGRGKVSQIAYDDVIENFSEELILYCDEVNATLCYDFNEDSASPNIEDFIVTAYLSINIERRQKDGRTAEDAAKFGIAYYHGARTTIIKAQESASDKISFSEIESALSSGTKAEKDILNYINEVLYGEK